MLKKALKFDYFYQLKILLIDCSTELHQIVYIFMTICNRLTPYRSFTVKNAKIQNVEKQRHALKVMKQKSIIYEEWAFYRQHCKFMHF